MWLCVVSLLSLILLAVPPTNFWFCVASLVRICLIHKRSSEKTGHMAPLPWLGLSFLFILSFAFSFLLSLRFFHSSQVNTVTHGHRVIRDKIWQSILNTACQNTILSLAFLSGEDLHLHIVTSYSLSLSFSFHYYIAHTKDWMASVRIKRTVELILSLSLTMSQLVHNTKFSVNVPVLCTVWRVNGVQSTVNSVHCTVSSVVIALLLLL